MKLQSFLLPLVAALYLSACTKSSLVGSDLLPSSDNINIVTTDTFPLKSRTEAEDSVRVYSSTSNLDRYLFGSMRSNIFGSYSSGIFAQMRLNSSQQDFSDAVLDSIILDIAYDPTVFWGDTLIKQKLRVYRLIEKPLYDDVYNADKVFQYESQPIGEVVDFAPKIRTKKPNTVRNSTNTADSITGYSLPHLHIKLNDALGQEFLANQPKHATNTDFLDFFKGIYIAPDTTANAAIIRFKLVDDLTKLKLHYHKQNTTAPLVFNYNVSTQSVKTVNFKHDYTSTPILSSLNDYVTGEQRLYIQGMQGVNTRIEIPDLSSLGRVMVNKAELTITALPILGEEGNYNKDFSPQLVALVRNEDSELVPITDFSIATNSGGAYFGGTPEIVNGVAQYKINITAYAQRLVDNRLLYNRAVYLSVYPKAKNPSYTVLAGAKHPQYPIKLDLIYTKLD